MKISNKISSSLKHVASIVLFAALFSVSLIQGMPIVFGTITGILSIVGIVVVTYSWINDIKNKKPKSDNVLKARTLIGFGAALAIIFIAYILFSYFYPGLPYTYSFITNDISTHQYKENKSFEYGGLNITIDAVKSNTTPALNDCEAYVNKLKNTSWATPDYIAVSGQNCIDNNNSRIKELEKSDRLDVTLSYMNKSDRLIKIPAAELYLVDNEGNKYEICDNGCKLVKEDLLPQSKVTNKYIFKSLPKDKKYKVVMKLPARATQIINLD